MTELPVRKKRLLVISAVFPPDIIGGAEMSASNLAQWFLRQGFEVGILTTAKTREEVCEGKEENGLKIWRVWMPRAYPAFYFAKGTKWQKPLWHLQDHFDPRNRKIFARVADAFNPDIINVHVLQGLGYNIIREITKRAIPFVYFLHDLSLACVRTSMFQKGRNGTECDGQCVTCKFSCAYKQTLFTPLTRASFCSPSRANLETLAKYFPVKKWPNAVVINANRYPAPTATRVASDRLRILYVGRLDTPKGVDVLLEATRQIAAHHPVSLTMAGTGPREKELREKYGSSGWCHFTGFISQKEISDLMINSDVLCIPSIWAENMPGVVVHALTLGLPVIGSDKGGIPELIEPEKNGLLVTPGDVDALRDALTKVIITPQLLASWSEYARENASKFDSDYLGAHMLRLVEANLVQAGDGNY